MSPSQAANHLSSGRIQFPDVPVREQPDFRALANRRTLSNTRVDDLELHSLAIQDRPRPPLPASDHEGHAFTSISAQPPISLLDELEWRQDDHRKAPSVRSDDSSNVLRKIGSKGTLLAGQGAPPNPFAFSPPSLSSHHSIEETEHPLSSHQNKTTASLSSHNSPSMMSLNSNSSAGLEPLEILRRAKTTRVTCGLDEELDYSTNLQDDDEDEVLADDLPPLLSTYYLKSGEFSRMRKQELDRLERKAERLVAVQAAKLDAAKSKSKSKKAASIDKTCEYEPVSILAAEAKFLAQGDASHKGKSVPRNKSTAKSKAKGDGRARLDTASSTDSKRQLDYVPIYVNGHGGSSSTSSTHEDSSSLSLGHSEPNSRFSVVGSSDISNASDSFDRKRHDDFKDVHSLSRSSLGRLFGKKKTSKSTWS